MRFAKIISVVAFTLAFAVSAQAELAGMTDQPAPVDSSSKSRSWSGLIGISGGNSMIARDGTIFMSVRIGIQWNDIIANGAWTTFLMDDVQNPNVKGRELVNYNAFGLFAEFFPYRNGAFAISVPLSVGGGVVNVIEKGDEAFSPEDKFFTGELSLHFNYRITRMLEVSIGGGYRMFAGISENNLDDMDFCTPFGELRFTFKE
ncbi:MAG: hypothetical protein IKN70_09870 [Fibrobacter sp.]|uniref:hypothetical protein n=1 Tax=Fibrobacter sp. TaxID=35828 RepID=UPI001B2A6CEA|nr:hypothetical protein [Fibrobacter sp.]MBO7060198.1 hypothetical protein [Fibrobacter sp.]MBO7104414.1 hypothetical protein [Fibrobacter sp.]MBR3670296.1 hypothetical protein [Fibrobacter sp.]